MRLPDIQLRGGQVLRFEVRFGEAAVSRRMPRGVPTCMLQVNLDNENSRVVYAFDDEVVSELRSSAGALGAPPSGFGQPPGPALRV